MNPLLLLTTIYLLSPGKLSSKEYVQISISSQLKAYQVGQPVRLDLHLKNLGKTTVYLNNLLEAGADVQFWVTNEQRKAVSLPDYALRNFAWPTRSSYTPIAPGGVLFRRDATRNWIKLKKPGRYRVKLEVSHMYPKQFTDKFNLPLCRFGPPGEIVIVVVK